MSTHGPRRTTVRVQVIGIKTNETPTKIIGVVEAIVFNCTTLPRLHSSSCLAQLPGCEDGGWGGLTACFNFEFSILLNGLDNERLLPI